MQDIERRDVLTGLVTIAGASAIGTSADAAVIAGQDPFPYEITRRLITYREARLTGLATTAFHLHLTRQNPRYPGVLPCQSHAWCDQPSMSISTLSTASDGVIKSLPVNNSAMTS